MHAGGYSRAEWRHGWSVVLASMCGTALSVLHLYSMGVFIQPISAEQGWSRTVVTSGLTIVAVITFFCAPWVGRMVDVAGSRPIAIAGVTLYCISFAMLGLTSKSAVVWFGLWVLVGLSLQFVKATVWTAAVAGRFDKARGTALALTLTGTGIGSTLNPVIAVKLIGWLGWREAYLIQAVMWGAICLPLTLLFTPKGRSEKLAAATPAVKMDKHELRRAYGSVAFLTLASSSVLSAIVVVSMTVHFVPMLTEFEVPLGQASALAGLLGVSSVVGRLCTGLLFDRFHAPYVAAAGFALPAVACVLMPLVTGTFAGTVLVACLAGAALGAETDIMAFLSVKYFGVENYGAIFGALISATSIAIGFGPTLTSFIHDTTGNYSAFYIGAVPLSLLASYLVTQGGKTKFEYQ